MKLVKVGAAALNQTALDWEGNRRNIVGAIRDARRAGVTILCLPELAISGYGCEDAFHSPSVPRIAWEVLRELQPETRGLVVAVGLPVFHQNALFNAACVLANGKIIGLTAKQHLAGDGIHYEPRFFKPWPKQLRATLQTADGEHPLGDLFYDIGGIRVGFEICEDAWVSTRPGAELARQGVDIILNPSASHFAFGKHEVRKRFVQEGSRAFGVSYVYANLLGNEAGRVIYDGEVMIASQGRLVAQGPRFSFADRVLTTAVVDVESTRGGRARLASYQPQLGGEQERCVATPFKFKPLRPTRPAAFGVPWEEGPHLKEEEFARAVALGLFDYLRKSRSNGFVVSLSGGADSAAVSSLVHLLAALGIQELGLAGFARKLGHLPRLARRPAGDLARHVTRQLLTCVYQATENSSAVTRQAARTVAEGLGAEYHELEIEPVVQEYCRLVEGALGRKLSWAKDDTALQNIQARARSPGIWMLANIKGALLVSTSNRSEAAVGYATMDGDTSGGLSPIAGIDKAFIRRWLVWLERTGLAGLAPLPCLGPVNDQQPTAELRPPERHQTDEADLMPYEVLDAIERAAIRDKRSPAEILVEISLLFPQYSRRQLEIWLRRFVNLWCRNQWKRERYAPSFHVDDENLDPKTWCRFPILSGGYVRELSEITKAATPDKARRKRRGNPA